MKKRLLFALAASLLLSACATNTSSSSTSSSAPTSSTDTNTASQYAKDLAYALNNPDATFPQLTTDIADNEAAVLIKTTAGLSKMKAADLDLALKEYFSEEELSQTFSVRGYKLTDKGRAALAANPGVIDRHPKKKF